MADSPTRDSATQAQAALANERTFLAWVRTALALLVTGVALVALALPVDTAWRAAAAAVLVLLSIAASAQSVLGWRSTHRALHRGEEVPELRLGGWFAAGLIAAALLLLVGWVVS